MGAKSCLQEGVVDHTSCVERPDTRIGEGVQFREELSPVCLRVGRVSSLNLILCSSEAFLQHKSESLLFNYTQPFTEDDIC